MAGGTHPAVPTTKTVLGVAALAGAGLWYYYSRDAKPERRGDRKPSVGFIGNLREQGKKFVIFYGSQSGTAAGFARRLARESARYGMKAVVVNPNECKWEELIQMSAMPDNIAVFVMATYGEGDPTDNAREFYDWLKHAEGNALRLDGVNYAVFGLGDRSYEEFNAMGIFVDERLEAIGARRIFDLGLGDHNDNIEEDFITWKEEFWITLGRTFGLKEVTKEWERQYELIRHPPGSLTEHQIYTGEMGWIGQYSDTMSTHCKSNPFAAELTEKRELYSGDRSCLHLEFDIRNSDLSYQPGDHLGLYPKNRPEVFERLGRLLNTNLEQIITLDAKDKDFAERPTPFPCPTSYRTALTHYVDVAEPPGTHILREIAKFCRVEREKELLLLMSSNTQQGKAKYKEWIVDACRSIIHVLEDLPSCKPPLDLLLELLPRLQPRYYSISSSPEAHPDSVHIVASVVDYRTPTERQTRGVATGMLARTEIGDTVPIFFRESHFRMPRSVQTPIIMVGPGTGVAPFRAFLYERSCQRRAGLNVGECHLFFGCRKKGEDFLYREELEGFDADDTCELYTAFSRDQQNKIYVTDLLRERKDLIWRILGGSEGAFYVCGEAGTVVRDVRRIVIDTLKEKGEMTFDEATEKLRGLEAQRRYRTDVWNV